MIEFFSNLFSLSPYTSSRRVFVFGFPVGFQSPFRFLSGGGLRFDRDYSLNDRDCCYNDYAKL